MKARRRSGGASRWIPAAAGFLVAITGVALTFVWGHSAPERVPNHRTADEARHDILKRPTCPYAWLRLASTLAQQGYYGTELDVALRQTTVLAPLEGTINFHRALMALDHSQAPLSHYSRNVLMTSLSNERKEHANLIQAYAFLNYRSREYCASPEKSEQEVHWCNASTFQHQRCRERHIDQSAETDCSKLLAYYATVLGKWKFAANIRPIKNHDV